MHSDDKVEPTYNLFLYVNNGAIEGIGACVHLQCGNDSDKSSFLRSRVNSDCHAAERMAFKQAISWGRYESMMRVGRHLEIFEPILEMLSAPQVPLIVITPIVDGYPTVMGTTHIGSLDFSKISIESPEASGWKDYLVAYVIDGGFDIPRLIDDDYFQAIKILFNNKKYVSAAKLLMSLIDTLAYIEYGDEAGVFVRWLDRYSDITSLGITALELWEFRNSLLHMTNQQSRKVLAGKHPKLAPFVGIVPSKDIPAPEGYKNFNLYGLIDVIANAISGWIADLNDNRDRMLTFIERYDTILSDARMATVVVSKS